MNSKFKFIPRVDIIEITLCSWHNRNNSVLKVCCVYLKFFQKNFCNLHVTWLIWFSASGYLERSSSSTDAPKLFAEVHGNEGDGEDERDGEDDDDDHEQGDEGGVHDGEDEGSDNDDDGEGDDRDREDGEGDDERGEGEEEDGIGGKMEAEFLDREHLKTIMAQQDPDLLRSMGHQFEDFVVYCTYRGVYCA